MYLKGTFLIKHRKQNGLRRVFDETQCLNDSEASDITSLEEMLQQLPLKENCHDDGGQRSVSLFSEPASTRSSLRGFLPSCESFNFFLFFIAS